jgi:catalase
VGEFVGSKEASRLSRSALFSGQSIPVVARFSLSVGNPKAPDTAKGARGMALEFIFPDDAIHQMTMLNTPMFGAAQPHNFLDLMLAQQADAATGKPDPEKMKTFKASHPDNRAQAEYLATHNPPVSYANSSFWGMHTFKFVSQQQKTTSVRWRFVPRDGEKRLTDEDMKTVGPTFLEQALVSRAHQGLIQWDMMVSIGQDGDTQDNPTIVWPDDRSVVNAGTLSTRAASAQAGAPCETINFDPLIMADGIEPSNDPILLFRSPAYAISYSRRLTGQ